MLQNTLLLFAVSAQLHTLHLWTKVTFRLQSNVCKEFSPGPIAPMVWILCVAGIGFSVSIAGGATATENPASIEILRDISYKPVAGRFKEPLLSGYSIWETGCVASSMKQTLVCSPSAAGEEAAKVKPELRAFHLDCSGWKASAYHWQAKFVIPRDFYVNCARVTIEVASNGTLASWEMHFLDPEKDPWHDHKR